MIHCAAEYKFLCPLYISAKQREKLKERAKSNFAWEKPKKKRLLNLKRRRPRMRNKRLEREKAIAEKEKMKNVKKIDSRKS